MKRELKDNGKGGSAVEGNSVFTQQSHTQTF